MVVSAVGGFPEVADAGAARLVPPGDTAALAAALRELIDDEGAREELAAAARAAAAGPYSWDEAARRTLALYEELLAGSAVTTLAAIVFWLCALAIVYAQVGYPFVLRALVTGAARPRNARRPAGAAPARARHAARRSGRWSR